MHIINLQIVLAPFLISSADRLAIYLEVAAELRATGERGSEVAALLVEQLADEMTEAAP